MKISVIDEKLLSFNSSTMKNKKTEPNKKIIYFYMSSAIERN